MASVCVVIPAWNRADLIGATLETVLAQTLAPHEVIVVDDGSSDGTPDVVRRFAPRVTLIEQTNAGVQAARNRGVAAATGDLIALLDSDDLWQPGYLAAMVALYDARPDLTFAFANFRIVLDGVWQEGAKFDTAPPGWWANLAPGKADTPDGAAAPGTAILEHGLLPNLLAFQPVFPSAIVMPRARYAAIGGFDVAMRGVKAEDFEFTLRAAAEGPVGVLHDALVGIRKHAGNDSADNRLTEMGRVTILDHAARHHPALAPHRAALAAEIRATALRIADMAFAEGHLGDVPRWLARAGAIPGEVPGAIPGKTRLKGLVAGLPGPLARPLARLLLTLSDRVGGR